MTRRVRIPLSRANATALSCLLLDWEMRRLLILVRGEALNARIERARAIA
jgi:hypothetical protein